MRRGFEPDEETYEAQEQEEAPADFVLGAPALLGIFFAIAVLGAVCFGFGYSAHSHAPLAAQSRTPAAARVPRPLGPSPSTSRETADENRDTNIAAESSSLPPEPDHTGEVVHAPAKPRPGSSVRIAAQPDAAEAGSPASIAGIKSGAGVTVPLAAPSAANTPVPVELAPLEGVMVQIAAVSRAADAQTLSAALRHDGFAAVVRTATGDPLFHVQVGPFATREAAKAMRAKLADNGYNAFVKN